jgi:ubiquinone/menaquinone biosynthesis C-methylase UbiE
MIETVVQQRVTPDASSAGLFHLETPPALIGISERYLANAEQDFQSFVNYLHPYWAVKKIIADAQISLENAVVIDLASGFGNTVIPLLRDFPSCRVVASDLSESILRILLREAGKEDLGERVQAVVCDAQDTRLWAPESADLVVGGAALHHMIDPSLTISAALAALKPGGTAMFMEPMEIGHAILRLALEEILLLPAMTETSDYEPAAGHFRVLIKDIDARTHHSIGGDHGPWRTLDDKWVFPRSYLEEIANRFGCKVAVLPLDPGTTPFTTKAVQSLELYGGLKAGENLPREAIDVLNRYDAAFSPSGRADIPIEAAITFTKMGLPVQEDGITSTNELSDMEARPDKSLQSQIDEMRAEMRRMQEKLARLAA